MKQGQAPITKAPIHFEIHLEEQMRRMLADPRSDAMAENFAGQWLHLRNLEGIHPNTDEFPDFDNDLRLAFQREAELFFSSVLREDRNVMDLLTADYTFVNERLARHYGIPQVYGSRFRRVTLGPEFDARRGSLVDDNVSRVDSPVSIIIGGAKVVVPKDQEELALAVLEEFRGRAGIGEPAEEESTSTRDEEYRCVHCQAHLEAETVVCGKCGLQPFE